MVRASWWWWDREEEAETKTETEGEGEGGETGNDGLGHHDGEYRAMCACSLSRV